MPAIVTNDPIERDLPSKIDLSNKSIDEIANPGSGARVKVEAAAARHSVSGLIFDMCRDDSINGYTIRAYLPAGTKLLYDPIPNRF
jgi:hypothetical protein